MSLKAGSRLRLAPETTWGQMPASPSFTQIPARAFSLGLARKVDVIRDYVSSESVTAAGAARAEEYRGGLAVPLRMSVAEALLGFALDRDGGQTTCVFEYFDDVTAVRHLGTVAAHMELTASAANPEAVIAVDLVARTEVRDVSPPGSWPSLDNVWPLVFHSAQATLDGDPLDVRAFKLSVDNHVTFGTHEADPTTGALELAWFEAGPQEATVVLELARADESIDELFGDAQAVDLVLDLATPVRSRTLNAESPGQSVAIEVKTPGVFSAGDDVAILGTWQGNRVLASTTVSTVSESAIYADLDENIDAGALVTLGLVSLSVKGLVVRDISPKQSSPVEPQVISATFATDRDAADAGVSYAVMPSS